MGGKDKVKDVFSGTLLGISSWVLPESLETIEKEPGNSLARKYRMCIECVLKQCWMPAAILIKQRLNDFPFPSREAFKKRFPCYANDGQLRKKMLLEFVDWACTMDMIVQNEWKNGDFSYATPGILYPLNVNTYMIMMVDTLKEDIRSMTDRTFDFNVTSTEEEYKNISKKFDRLDSDNNKPGEAATGKSNKKKYAVAAAAAGSTVLATTTTLAARP